MTQDDDPIQVNGAAAGRWRRRAGQSLTEFGLVLPLILLFAFGIFEFGRILYLFSEVNNAGREAARYGASVGEQGTGTTRYLDCDAMRAAARSTAILSGLRDDEIEIAYDRNDGSGGMAIYAQCGDAGLGPEDVVLGDRIVVTVTKNVTPMLGLLPMLPTFSPVAVVRRTILKDLPLGHPECRDGVDNDGDGTIDYPGDAGCSGPDDTIEAICYRLSAVPQLDAPIGSPYEGAIDYGTVDIGPASNCTARYIEETQVTLQALASPPTYTFAYWGGDASGTTSSLVFSINSDRDIVAHFRPRTAELRVVKFDDPDPIGVGESLEYMIQVSNLYTDTATSVVLTDTLPAGVTLISVSVPGGCTSSVNGSGQTVLRCDQLGPIDAGNSVLGRITVEAPMSSGDIHNTVSVSAFEYDPNLSNNTFTETTTVIPLADLSVDKSDSAYDPVYAGELLTYTVSITNNGPSPATDVVLTDTLPSGVSFYSSSHTCMQNGSTVICTVGDLGVSASDKTAAVRLTVTAPEQGGGITNQVTVSANEVDRDPSNNSASEDTTVVPQADLEIQKSDSADPATRDVPFSYQLTVTNNGPSTATGVTVTDTLPATVFYESSTTSLGSGCSASGNIVTCSLGDMIKGQSASITIAVMPTAEGVITNTASATSGVHDGSTSNNSDTETTAVEAQIGLALSKSGPSSVYLGEPITYTISVSNSGPSVAWNVVVTDTLPDNITYGGVSSITGDWSCGGYDAGTGELVCTLPQLDASADADFSITVTPTITGTLTNSAIVTADEDTTGVSSNTVTTTVNPSLSQSDPQTSVIDAPLTERVAALAEMIDRWQQRQVL